VYGVFHNEHRPAEEQVSRYVAVFDGSLKGLFQDKWSGSN